MATAKVMLGLTGLTIDQKRQAASTILAKMTGNPNFPTPVPPLTSLSTTIDELVAQINLIAETRRTLAQQITERNQRLSHMVETLEALAVYVQGASGGDPAKILSSGMLVRPEPQPVGPMPKISDVRATAGPDTHEVSLRWKPVHGRQSYLIEAATPNGSPDVPGEFHIVGVTAAARFTAVNLAPLSRYWFRVRANGASGPGPWSDPATAVVA